MSKTGTSDESEATEIAREMVAQHGGDAIEVAETLAKAMSGSGRAFWHRVAEAIRALPQH
jgi:hypothetical protein